MTSIEESEWDVLLDENGRTYYKNKITDTIQYEAPYEMMMKAWKNADASLWYFDLQIYAYACLGGKEESSALKERQVCWHFSVLLSGDFILSLTSLPTSQMLLWYQFRPKRWRKSCFWGTLTDSLRFIASLSYMPTRLLSQVSISWHYAHMSSPISESSPWPIREAWFIMWRPPLVFLVEILLTVWETEATASTEPPSTTRTTKNWLERRDSWCLSMMVPTCMSLLCESIACRNLSRFLITLNPCPQYTGIYTVFGHVIKGMSVLRAMCKYVQDSPSGIPKYVDSLCSLLLSIPICIARCGSLEPGPKPVDFTLPVMPTQRDNPFVMVAPKAITGRYTVIGYQTKMEEKKQAVVDQDKKAAKEEASADNTEKKEGEEGTEQTKRVLEGEEEAPKETTDPNYEQQMMEYYKQYGYYPYYGAGTGAADGTTTDAMKAYQDYQYYQYYQNYQYYVCAVVSVDECRITLQLTDTRFRPPSTPRPVNTFLLVCSWGNRSRCRWGCLLSEPQSFWWLWESCLEQLYESREPSDISGEVQTKQEVVASGLQVMEGI